jgi:hypothetical protein
MEYIYSIINGYIHIDRRNVRRVYRNNTTDGPRVRRYSKRSDINVDCRVEPSGVFEGGRRGKSPPLRNFLYK